MPVRRIALIVSLAFAVFAAAAPVLAGGPGEARVDPPIQRDTEPGGTLAVEFDAVALGDDGSSSPWSGTPMSVRLVPVDGQEVSDPVLATEVPFGSGHYVAQMTVPASGIRDVEIGVWGESCTDDICRPSDLPLAIAAGSVVGDAPAVAGSVVTSAGAGASDGGGADPSTLVQVVVLVVLAGLGGAVLYRLVATDRARRRPDHV